MKTFNFFITNFNNSVNNFSSLTYGCRNNVAILDKLDVNGVSIFSFKKDAFVIL